MGGPRPLSVAVQRINIVVPGPHRGAAAAHKGHAHGRHKDGVQTVQPTRSCVALRIRAFAHVLGTT